MSLSNQDLDGEGKRYCVSGRTIRGFRHCITGHYNTIYANNSKIFGTNNKIYGVDNEIDGDSNEIYGSNNKYIGYSNKNFSDTNTDKSGKNDSTPIVVMPLNSTFNAFSKEPIGPDGKPRELTHEERLAKLCEIPEYANKVKIAFDLIDKQLQKIKDEQQLKRIKVISNLYKKKIIESEEEERKQALLILEEAEEAAEQEKEEETTRIDQKEMVRIKKIAELLKNEGGVTQKNKRKTNNTIKKSKDDSNDEYKSCDENLNSD